MKMRKTVFFASVVVALVALALGVGPGWAQPPEVTNKLTEKRLLDAEKKAAAARAKKLGLKPGAAALAAQVPDPGGVPHYFGPYGNWAYSPLPSGPIASVRIVDGGTGYSSAPTVTIDDAYLPGVSWSFLVTATGGVVDPVTILPSGSPNFMAPVVTITDSTGTGATATATLDVTTLTGGIRKFVDPLPGLWDPRNGPAPTKSIPLAVPDVVTYPGSDYYEIALRSYSDWHFHSSLPATRMLGYVQTNSGTANVYDPITNPGGCVRPGDTLPTGLSYCVTTGPKVTPAEIRYLGPTIVGTSNRAVRIKFTNELPVGPADPATGRRPGDLFLPVDETVMGSGYGPAGPGTAGETYTQNRAAVHLHGNNTVWISDGTPHQWITPAGETTNYPKGVSVRNVPDMWFDPVTHATVPAGTPGATNDPGPGSLTIYYTNAMSARLMFYHDHAMGITRLNVYAGEAAGYVLTDAVDQDMINGTNFSGVNINCADGGDGGTIAGDSPGECSSVLPGIGIPLVIQDRTFVDNNTVFAQDPTWNWGTGAVVGGKITEAVTGDLWYPHVYMSAQNPWDLGGMNAFGRWHYGPWFTPPTPECVNGFPLGCIEVGPVPNPYCLPQPPTICDGTSTPPTPYDCSAAPWEPPCRPGVPNPSIPGEAFNDTPIVNGTAYPVLEVEPRAYRFRILNAANDRFLNLQLYKAADKNTWTDAIPATPTTPFIPGTPATLCGPNPPDPTVCTEVKMIPVGSARNQVADLASGLPDPATAGPQWWQIGTEGGFLAVPTKVPIQPIGWNTDPTAFNVGVVNQHSLLLGTAERADVIVDFTGYDNQVLILYNDAPAAFPAGVPTYDYYTGVADQIDVGGAPGTLPGLGPNTRTIMQIRVKPKAATDLDTSQVTFANLQDVFAKGPGTKRGVFEVSQDPIIVPQAAYSSAYNATGPNAFPSDASQYLHIPDTEMTFRPIGKDGALQAPVTMPLQMKAMHDEMGGVYDTLFGRMSGMLGLTNPQRGNAFLIPYGYASPPTDIIRSSADVDAAPVGSLADGTQIWRIFHNGVDTHTIHVHLFNAQLINRIGQDNWMVDAEPSEFGWKDTFRINPLEVTFLAMKPILPTQAQLPFEVPNSVRLIDPTLPEGASLIPPPPAGWFDPAGTQITEILNHYVNFGWEYVWHCHILAHEEMDMMHSLVAAVPPMAPTLLTPSYTVTGPPANPVVNLFWQDNSENETHFTIQRATNNAFTEGLTTFIYVNTTSVKGPVTYADAVTRDAVYSYRVFASNLVGDTNVYPAPSIGFPTMTANSDPVFVNNVVVGTPPAVPAAPTALVATLLAPTATIPGPRVNLTWQDNAPNNASETGFVVERCTGVNCSLVPANFAQIAQPGPRNSTGSVTYVDTTVTAGNSYSYRVKAINLGGSSAYAPAPSAPPVVVTIPPPPAAPTSLKVTLGAISGQNISLTLDWFYGTTPGPQITGGGYLIQRATNARYTTNVANFTDALSPFTQNVKRNTTYYYRIRAYNLGGSSGWTPLPVPIRP